MTENIINNESYNENIYSELEKKMVKYSDLVSYRVIENNEKFVDAKKEAQKLDLRLSFEIFDKELYNQTEGKIYIRKNVFNRLINANCLLTEKDLSLQVICGYRPLEIQQEMYNKVLNQLKQNNDGREITAEEVHRFVAVPEVAGHPSGGAVDIQIIDKRGNPLDFGTQIVEFVKKSYVFSPEVSEKVKMNRLLLRDVMMNAGFAPFDGEWWHFSYGDREWAFYYKKTYAKYDVLNFCDLCK